MQRLLHTVTVSVRRYSSLLTSFIVICLLPHFISDSIASRESVSAKLDQLLQAENLFSGLGGGRNGKSYGLMEEDGGNLDLLEILKEQLDNPSILRRLHNKYQKTYEKTKSDYKADSSTKTEERNTFRERLLHIANHNLLAQRGLYSYVKGVNQWTDLDIQPENLSPQNTNNRSARTFFYGWSTNGYHNQQQQPTPWFPHLYGKRDSEKTSLDWRNYGAVSYPKNQGRCGSCSFFATVAALESHNYLVKMASASGRSSRSSRSSSSSYIWGSPPDLSEQELLDCARNFSGYRGCNDNLPTTALDYMKQHGLSYEYDYPYQDKVGTVCYAPWNRNKLRLDGYYPVWPNHDEERLKQVVRDWGPVIAGMHMSLDLKMYKGGIYDQQCQDPNGIQHNIFRNHMVLIVGYGVEWVNGKNVEYWIVKNSYGSNWGNGGFFKIARNKRLCLIGEESYYLYSGSPYGIS